MMNTSRRLPLAFAAFFFLAAVPSVFAQSAQSSDAGLSQHVMTVWTDREGLPSDTILDVVQDSSGYIWLASYDGLVRFDGEKFSVLSPQDGGFDGRSARVLECANDGSLWVGTNTKGLYVLKDGAFAHYGTEEGLPDLSVRSIAFDGDGRAWIGTANGVSRLDGGRFVSAVASGSESFGIANFLLPLQDGTVVVGSNLPGLWLITPRGAEKYLAKQGVGSWSFSAAFLDRSGQLWLGTSSGQILRVSRNEIRETISIDYLKGSSVNAFYADSDGTLWVATDRGIVSLRGSSISNFSEINGLPGNVVSALCRDREGNLWVGTERGGLIKFSPGKFVNTSKRDGLISDAVNAVTEDSFRSVWVATDEGVSFFPSEKDPYRAGGSRRASVDAIVKKMNGVRVRQIRMERDGSLFFATYSDDGLLVLAPDGGVSSFTKKNGLPTNRVRFSFRTSKGDLWVGTTAGPVLYSGDRVIPFGPDSGLPNLFILCVMEDAEGNIWLGTDGGGVSRYNGSSFRTMTTAEGLSGNVVFRIFRDSKDRLWFCSSEGLNLYADGKFHRADNPIGVEGQSVFEVLEDFSNRLWIVTGRRVVVVSADDLASAANQGYVIPGSRSYDRLDGLAGQLSANAWAYMNDMGIVYLPTLKGLSTYNPQSVQLNLLPPPVLLEKLLVDGAPVDPGKKPVEIAAGSKRITFYYTALSFVVPQRVRFQYKLEGYDAEWMSSGVNREIAYTNLPPGKYTFRVKAENNDGVINETGAELPFRMRPFFWQTLPFYLACGFLLVCSGFIVAAMRGWRLERRARELDALVHERTRELAFEKEKSDTLLLNVLPPAVAEELKNTGRATPLVYRDTAVLFADIVGFTPWSATMQPDEIIRELNEIFTAFDEIMGKFGCERIKTIGDGYLACCGLPVADAECALKLVRAGIEMLDYIERRKNTNPHRLEIRVGVNSGAIVGGVVGVKKYIFDVFGDTVNTAFRLEGLSVPMGLTVSADVAEAVRGEFTLLERPGRLVKGKGLMPSFYVRYRDRGNASMDNVRAIAEYSRALALFGEGKLDESLAIVESFDYATIEPELGYDLFHLAGKISDRRGDSARAAECVALANRYHV
jgi:ligand-binding sensor domain-containing protein/class 3 adenylate cyclase